MPTTETINFPNAHKVLMLTDEQAADFERLALMIKSGHPKRMQFIGELLVLLGILMPSEARRQFGDAE